MMIVDKKPLLTGSLQSPGAALLAEEVRPYARNGTESRSRQGEEVSGRDTALGELRRCRHRDIAIRSERYPAQLIVGVRVHFR